ncbi:unnamed protein product, partial [Gulo gulo]
MEHLPSFRQMSKPDREKRKRSLALDKESSCPQPASPLSVPNLYLEKEKLRGSNPTSVWERNKD